MSHTKRTTAKNQKKKTSIISTQNTYINPLTQNQNTNIHLRKPASKLRTAKPARQLSREKPAPQLRTAQPASSLCIGKNSQIHINTAETSAPSTRTTKTNDHTTQQPPPNHTPIHTHFRTKKIHKNFSQRTTDKDSTTISTNYKNDSNNQKLPTTEKQLQNFKEIQTNSKRKTSTQQLWTRIQSKIQFLTWKTMNTKLRNKTNF